MSTRDDPLGQTPEAPDRVFYATGIQLAADDFQSEQLYHRGRLARALAYLHGGGTVAGLEVRCLPASPERGERLLVRPGLALDRLGRLIEVPREACLRLDLWFEAQPDPKMIEAFHPDKGGIVADVFVRFVACERGLTPAFASGPFDALDAVQPARLRDGYEIKVVPRTEGDVDKCLPTSPWDAVRADGSVTELQQKILESWPGDGWTVRTDGTPPALAPLPEHVKDQDPTSVFLARLVLPATRPGGAGRPVRTAGAQVAIDNYRRAFAYPVAALGRRLGLVGP